MNETSKTKLLFDENVLEILKGSGIDIGCGNDPVTEHVVMFDIEDGDANYITKYIKQQFDFVFSSHCLEHMDDPSLALNEWWSLVKDYGHLIFAVPDEDLYEQGIFPSIFNEDHKYTFTIAKNKSWSPVSINVLDLIKSLPNSKLIRLELQDNNYDRRLCLHNIRNNKNNLEILKKPSATYKLIMQHVLFVRRFLLCYKTPIDQTLISDAVAQIFCIMQKIPNNS